ncbi:MAG: hypothetical protein NT029_16195 [Armatimonadetes bacterium]|nr:hypothetical protein [Armatimonadota bacterium]
MNLRIPGSIACLAVLLSAAPLAGAQTAPADVPVVAAPAPTINYRVRPSYPFEPQRLRLRPTLDGVIGETEWTPLYTVGDGPATGTVYLNWDAESLYVAIKAAKPGWAVIDLDANGDGWLRGNDNVEITVAPRGVEGVPVLSARVLDAASDKDAPVWNAKAVDVSQISLVMGDAAGGQVTEIAIPRGMVGLEPRAGASIGFRADLLPAGAAPTATPPYEPHLLLELSLVASKAAAATGIVPRLTLDDDTVVAGSTFRATMQVMNQIDQARAVRSVTWQGQGAAAEIVKSVREVAAPPVPGLGDVKLRYQTVIPETAVPGSYRLNSAVQLDNATEVSATASFEVVEAYKLSAIIYPPSVTVLGPVQVRCTVEVLCNLPRYSSADLAISAPAAFELKGKPTRRVSSHGDGSVSRITYLLTVPSATQAGDYPISATLTWKGKTWKAQTTLKVTRADGPK